MKKKLLILFPEGNLPYSPTTLNLVNLTKEIFDVYLICSTGSDESHLDKTGFTIIRCSADLKKLRYFAIRRFLSRRISQAADDDRTTYQAFVDAEKFKIIRHTVESIQPDQVIAIDLFALYCCQQLNFPCVFLSLEIPAKSVFLNALNFKRIRAVLIQSEVRYDHLFAKRGIKPRWFLLQNSPVFHPPERRSTVGGNLLYNGYVWSAFGTQFCLALITKYPEYKLSIKGALHNESLIQLYYPFLLNSTQLSLDESYLGAAELAEYMAGCSIGFCFYYFGHPFIKANAFNYETGPSGKLYAYLNAGLPVICSDIPAFQVVKDSGAGILVSDYSPESLRSAIETILASYSYYSDNALRLAQVNCFQKNIEPIVAFMVTNAAS